MAWKNIDDLFYANGNEVDLSKIPEGVERYIVYSSLEPLVINHKPGDVHKFEVGELLEVCKVWSYERIFYTCLGSKMARVFFHEISEEEEGEEVLRKHLGLR